MKKAATLWVWGDDFENVRKNCEKYISKKWGGNVKECSIEISARKRDEDICYYLVAYTSKPQSVGDLAEGLFYTALDENDVKVTFVSIDLFDKMLSGEEVYRKSMEDVEKELREREKAIVEKFSEDPKVKSAAQGRKIVFIPQTNLLCELSSKIANKIIIEVMHEDLSSMKDLLYSLSNRMLERGLAERILGYDWWKDIDELKIGDIEIQKDEVLVWLV